jgi:hypothetical protein
MRVYLRSARRYLRSRRSRSQAPLGLNSGQHRRRHAPPDILFYEIFILRPYTYIYTFVHRLLHRDRSRLIPWFTRTLRRTHSDLEDSEPVRY